jgi:hypothetical protein
MAVGHQDGQLYLESAWVSPVEHVAPFVLHVHRLRQPQDEGQMCRQLASLVFIPVHPCPYSHIRAFSRDIQGLGPGLWILESRTYVTWMWTSVSVAPSHDLTALCGRLW